MSNIPCGYCQCGCGQKTKLAKHDNEKYGIKVGQPNFFLNNHHKTWTKTMEERFWSKVIKRDKETCWTWTGSQDPRGYGHFWTGINMTNAHRASWLIHYGPIVKNVFVLHRCDNPNCVNPDHLFLGTQQDNMTDMAEKGRRVNGNAKLTRTQAELIRQLRGKIKHRELANLFSISIPTIEKIVGNKIWRT